MEHQSLGKQIKAARQRKELSQNELAELCNLNIRTIQRIENDEVTPRTYTLKIIGDVLGVTLIRNHNIKTVNEELIQLRNVFEKRKRIRIGTLIFAIFLLSAALLLLITGLPKRLWASFFYLFFFADLIVIGFTWRCPGCNRLLGEVFNVKYCSNCGLRFYDE